MEKVNIKFIIGICNFANKEKYEGNWENGRICGKGKIDKGL